MELKKNEIIKIINDVKKNRIKKYCKFSRYSSCRKSTSRYICL